MGSVQNLVKNTPMSFHEIAQITSTNCAKYLGIDDQVGSIEVGKCADFTVVSKDLDLLATIIDGEVVYRA
jgi:N-acetylglucosamine-6-phosphate deacetylase